MFKKGIRNFLNQLTYVAVFLMASGCFKDDFNDLKIQDWHPEVALPLLNAEFTVGDIISKFETGGYLKSDAEGLISLYYTGEILSLQGNDLFKIPDLPYSFLEKTAEVAFPFDSGEIINQITLTMGELHYQIVSAEGQDLEIVLNIPQALKDGLPFREKILLISNGSILQEIEGIIDLSGYSLDLSQSPNELQLSYEAVNLENKKEVILNEFSGELTKLLFNYMEGYFGNKNLGEYLDTLKIDIFENWVGGSIFLEEPKMNIAIENSFGFPIIANFSNFNAYNPDFSQNLEGDIISKGIDCNFPGVPKAGHTGNSTYTINPDNSNLRNFLSLSPNKISYGFSFTGNTKADFSQLNFFIADTSVLKVNLDLEIPLHGKIENVILLDTFNFHMKNKKRIDNATFKLLIENTFPNDAEIQVFFTTGTYEVLDSLLTPLKDVVTSGIVSENGFVTSSSIEETYIPVSNARYIQLLEAEKILVRVKLVSFNKENQSVKYALGNGLSIKMGVVAGLKP